jgi:hypothetical protein
MFGVSRAKPTREIARRMETIAQRHGAGLVEATIPGTGYRRWFAGPNRGDPFDRALCAAIFADLRAAGIVDDKDELVERPPAVRS